MFKKFMMVMFSLWLSGLAHAVVDVNKADQAALDGIRGIGPAMSKRILDERQKGGEFKDWSDLRQRVKGIKDKSAAKLSTNGLTVNGRAMPGAAPAGANDGRATKSERLEKAAPGSRAGKAALAQQSGADASTAAPRK